MHAIGSFGVTTSYNRQYYQYHKEQGRFLALGTRSYPFPCTPEARLSEGRGPIGRSIRALCLAMEAPRPVTGLMSQTARQVMRKERGPGSNVRGTVYVCLYLLDGLKIIPV